MNEMQKLRAAVEQLPLGYRLTLLPLIEQLTEQQNRRQILLGKVRETLGQLRVDMKYLMFDLECTRRERNELRERT